MKQKLRRLVIVVVALVVAAGWMLNSNQTTSRASGSKGSSNIHCIKGQLTFYP